MVEPSFLALTTTPSIKPSRAELTSPERAAGACADAGMPADEASAANPAARASNIVGMRIKSLPFGRAGIGRPCLGLVIVIGESLAARVKPLKDARAREAGRHGRAHLWPRLSLR
jgi:hypothetical protein